MKNFLFRGIIAICFAAMFFSQNAGADWETISAGFDYQKFTEAGNTLVYVARMLNGNQNYAFDTMIAGGYLKSANVSYGRETVSGMVSRYNDGLNDYYWKTWGKRNDIIAAVNGDYWERESYPSGPYTGYPLGGQVQSGWFLRRYGGFSGGSGVFVNAWGVPKIGGDVWNGDNPAARQKIVFADSSEAIITNINLPRGSEDLIVYTRHNGPHTQTNNSGVEVVLELNNPSFPYAYGAPSNSCTGTIKEIRDGQGSTYIPYDQIVLSGSGSYATTLRNKCVLGQTISIFLTIRDYGFNDRTPKHPAQDWTSCYGSIGCDREILIDSQVTNLPKSDTLKRARTAFAYNATYTFLVVVDEFMNNGSYGMNFQELAEFCRDRLSATHAASVDGGGSSCMWIKGKGIVNVPSDGSERATYNGMMFVNLLPATYSTAFSEGTPVTNNKGALLYLGPGTNFSFRASLPRGQTGTILSHMKNISSTESINMNGVYAKGQYWWKWSVNGMEGWTREDDLQDITSIENWEIFN